MTDKQKAAEPGIDEDLVHHAEVPPELAGKRFDAVCARLFDTWSRARLSGWIGEGRARVNGEVVTLGRTLVNAGDRTSVEVEE